MNLYPKMNSKNSLLLIIDPINSCAHKKCEIPEWNIHFKKIREMLPKLNDFVKKYEKVVNNQVVFTNTTPWKKEYLTENINELYLFPPATYYSKDDTGFAEEFNGVEINNYPVVTKNHYDVFTTKGFDEMLKTLGIKYIVVAGIFGDGCVLASIIGGFSRGYNFVILDDLIETSDSETRQSLLALLKKFTFPVMYGLTMNSDTFLDIWSKEQHK